MVWMNKLIDLTMLNVIRKNMLDEQGMQIRK